MGENLPVDAALLNKAFELEILKLKVKPVPIPRQTVKQEKPVPAPMNRLELERPVSTPKLKPIKQNITIMKRDTPTNNDYELQSSAIERLLKQYTKTRTKLC